MPVGCALARRRVQGLARGDPQLVGDEIATRHELGDRVLDLQARVHLEERELAALAEEELAGAGADIPDRTGEGQRGLPKPCAEGRIDRR